MHVYKANLAKLDCGLDQSPTVMAGDNNKTISVENWDLYDPIIQNPSWASDRDQQLGHQPVYLFLSLNIKQILIILKIPINR